MTRRILEDSVNQDVTLHIVDDTTGLPETGVVWNTAGIDLWYRRTGAAKVSITEATLASLTTAHADGGFLTISNGDYRFDLPDAAFATGADGVQIGGTVTGMVVFGPYCEIVTLQDANVIQISGDATAADNLELQYDTTGLTGDTFPSTQSQLAGIANVGSAAHEAFSGEVLTTPATTTSGSYTDTKALDGIYMNWDTVSGGFDAELTSNIGAGVPSGIKITGYLNGNNDSLRVQMWDYQAGTPAWVTIGPWVGSASTSNQVLPFDAFIGMVGLGANLGDIRIRLYNDNGTVDTALTSANIYIDQVFVEFNEGSSNALDSVYFDSTASNTGTTSVDGTPGNPVSTEAAVNTLLASRNLNSVQVALGSSITFATVHNGELWQGEEWTLGLGGRDIADSHIHGAAVSGTAIGATTAFYESCSFGIATLNQFHMHDCSYADTITFGNAGNYIIYGGHSSVAGSGTPVFDTGAAIGNVNFSVADWHKGFELRNLNATGSDLFSIEGDGQIIYAASCSGAVSQYGKWKETNTGGVTITRDDDTQSVINILDDTGTSGVLIAPTGLDLIVSTATGMVEIAKAVWDRIISKANHNIGQSAGKNLRELGVLISAEGAVSGTPTPTVFTTNITGHDDDFFKDQVVSAYNGAVMAGQGRVVSAYNGTTGVFTVDEAFTTALSSGDDVVVFTPHVHPISQIQAGLATTANLELRTPTAAQLLYITENAATGVPVTFTTSGGATTTAVLALVDGSAGSATNDQYNGRLLVFTDGTLKGCVTDITDYVGSTTTATITAIPFAPTASHNARLI